MNQFKLVVSGVLIFALLVAALLVRNVARKASTAKATSTAVAEDTTKITTLQLDKATPFPRTPRTTSAPTKSARETSAALNMRRAERTVADELIAISGTDTVSGTVWEQGQGGLTALPGATVRLLSSVALPTEEPAVLRTAVSDAQGSFTLTKLNRTPLRFNQSSGGHALAASKEGYEFAWFNPIDNEFTLRPETSNSYEGLVVDADTSQPLAGVAVYVQQSYPQRKYVSDAQGKFTMTDSRSSHPKLVAVRTGYRPVSVIWASSDPQRPAATTPLITMAAGNGATIKGSVLDSLGEPVRGVSLIHATKQPWETITTVRTDADGNFTVANLPPGQVILGAERTLGRSTMLLDLKGNETVEDVKLYIGASVSLTGIVRDTVDAQPLPNVKLSFGLSNMVTTDKNGEFAVQVQTSGGLFNPPPGMTPEMTAQMPPAQCIVTIDEPGMEFVLNNGVTRSVSHTIFFEQGDKTKHVELSVEQDLPSISGSVMFNNGAPFEVGGYASVLVAFHDADGIRHSMGRAYADNTYNVRLPQTAKLSKAFLMFADGNYASVVPLTGHKTEFNIVCDYPLITRSQMFQPYKIVLTDGTLIVQNAEDKFGVDAMYFADDGLYVTSNVRSQRFGGIPEDNTMLFQMIDWPHTKLRISLPDDVVIEKPVNPAELRGKKATFIYDPVKKDVTIEIDPI